MVLGTEGFKANERTREDATARTCPGARAFLLKPEEARERERESALSGMDNGWGSAPARGGEDCSRPKHLAKQMCESASESESG